MATVDAAAVTTKFRMFDRNGDGKIDLRELKMVLRVLDKAWTEDRLLRLFRVVDTNGDGSIDYEEFVSWAFRHTAVRTTDICAFRDAVSVQISPSIENKLQRADERLRLREEEMQRAADELAKAQAEEEQREVERKLAAEIAERRRLDEEAKAERRRRAEEAEAERQRCAEEDEKQRIAKNVADEARRAAFLGKCTLRYESMSLDDLVDESLSRGLFSQPPDLELEGQIGEDLLQEERSAQELLEVAYTALNRLRLSNLVEVKALATPPRGIVLTMEALCIVFQVKPLKKRHPGMLDYQLDYWNAARRTLLADPNKTMRDIFQLRNEDIPEGCFFELQNFLRRHDHDFQPELVKMASIACEAFCLWVRAIDAFPRRESIIIQLSEPELDSSGTWVLQPSTLGGSALDPVAMEEGLGEAKLRKTLTARESYAGALGLLLPSGHRLPRGGKGDNALCVLLCDAKAAMRAGQWVDAGASMESYRSMLISALALLEASETPELSEDDKLDFISRLQDATATTRKIYLQREEFRKDH